MCARAPSPINYHFRCFPRKTRLATKQWRAQQTFGRWTQKNSRKLFDINVWCTWGDGACRALQSIDRALCRWWDAGMCQIEFETLQTDHVQCSLVSNENANTIFFCSVRLRLVACRLIDRYKRVHRVRCVRGLCTQKISFSQTIWQTKCEFSSFPLWEIADDIIELGILERILHAPQSFVVYDGSSWFSFSSTRLQCSVLTPFIDSTQAKS